MRIAFYHSAARNKYNHASESHGWFVDEVKIVSGTPQFSGDFETGWGDWSADRGVWQVGTPGAGPAECYAGSSCVGTTLNGVHPVNTDSRLISAPFEVSGVQPRLTFWQWFSYSSHDFGIVQISVQTDGVWSDWKNLGNSQVNVCALPFITVRRGTNTTMLRKVMAGLWMK
ncbi:MAG: hypothetical protein JRE64_17640 [Deltaproteobacteria bacterium]|nr:hypothetical protein [Deltaproteobacteria bacterium]